MTTTHLAIVMEYAGGGELFTRVAAPPRHHLTESEARTFFRELLAGVEYCHSVVRRPPLPGIMACVGKVALCSAGVPWQCVIIACSPGIECALFYDEDK